MAKRILYAVQKTGNGHLARAEELLPILQKLGDVDVLASGSQSEIKLKFPIKYNLSGISLFYTKKGGLSFRKIIFKNNYFTFLKNVFSIPFHDYDLIINDFEPVSAWSCKLFGGNIVALSHQASLWFPETPKPKKINPFLRFVIDYYAPVKKFYGFHFQSYQPDIFTPVIRKKIRNLKPVVSEKYVVYLPSFSDENLYEILKNFSTEWRCFSKNTSEEYQKENCYFSPINEDSFLHHLESCKGVLCNAGFELPAEALFLKKKLLVIPIHLQLEQYYNAQALQELGIATTFQLSEDCISNWLNDSKNFVVDYPDRSEEILKKVIFENIEKIT